MTGTAQKTCTVPPTRKSIPCPGSREIEPGAIVRCNIPAITVVPAATKESKSSSCLIQRFGSSSTRSDVMIIIRSVTMLVNKVPQFFIKLVYKSSTMDPKGLINNQKMLLPLQNRSKRPYRAGTGIMIDILNVVKDCGLQGAKISEIARRANLSHYSTLDKCKKMTDVELLRSKQDRRNHMYIIT